MSITLTPEERARFDAAAERQRHEEALLWEFEVARETTPERIHERLLDLEARMERLEKATLPEGEV